MEKVVIFIATKVLEYSVDPVIREGRYLFRVSKITKTLENEKVKLTLTRDGVYQRVEEAKKKTESIEDVVEKWLHEVQNLLAEVENLEKELTANSCARGLCPTWRRYRLCKQLAKKVEIMAELNDKSKFERFSHLANLPSIEYFPSGNFTCFESTKLAYDQLLEAIRDDGCYMIGLYGMGGCGKTTLVKEVGKRAKDLNVFDQVVFTTVSQTPNIRRIQGEIADLLGLKLDEESEGGRARRLSLRLRSGERILVILDDVWAKLKLEDIGIPLDGNLKACKVLLTTRLRQLCTLMDCQRNVPLFLLSEKDAWILFRKHACVVDESSSRFLNIVAREVAMECKGLPIAIEAVGTSLKGKSLDEWKVALDKLRHSKPIDVEEGMRDAFACLQLSYDYLKSKEAKFLFLMCSMFPEDHEISVEDLFRYGIGLGLCAEVDSFEISRSQVNAGLNHLLDSSLLIHFEGTKNYWKMHDMIRDVALWIASKDNCFVMVNHAKGLNSLALDGAIKYCFAISTWYKGTDQFPKQLDAPKLEILLLNPKSLMDLSHASFEGMKGLKVMAIIAPPDYLFSMIKVLLPQSIQWLTNLQTLRFVGCELGDISFLLSLKRLEILDLRRSRFKVLPYGIEKLNKLKLLDLSRCKIDDCCDEVIGRCSQLEELYVYSEESPIGARIIDSSFLENVTFPKLQRYILKIGQYKGLCGFEYSCIRGLLLGELNIYTSGAIIKDLLQRADEVSLDSLHGGCKSIIPELVEAVGSMMSQLTRLYLCSCSEIEFLIRTNPAHGYCFQVDHVFPMLYELSLVSMYNLKQVCHGPLPSIFQKLERVSIEICDQLQSIFPGNCNLCNLRYLSISNCPKLTSLFTMSVAQTLLLLQKLNVEKCTELKYIIFNEKAGTATRGQQFPVSDNSPLMFPNLRYLSVNRCDKLEYIFPISCAQGLVQLQEISIRYASQMKYVFDKNAGEDLSTNQNEIQIVFPHLKVFMLQNLPNLIKICSENYHPCWPSLKKLDWKNCLKLTAACGNINFGFKLTETLSNREDKPLPYGVVIKFSTLTKHIKDNSNPRERESGDNVTMFIEITLNRELQSLVIHDGQVCNEVSNLQASSNAIKQLPIDEEKEKILTSSVEWLHLEHLPDLMFIWISFQNIDILEVSGCKKLKSIFSTTVIRSLPKLSHLDIGDCDELEEIISDPDFQEQAFGNPSSSTCPQKVCFPNLRDLNVERCSKLKCLFSVTKKRASDETNDEEVIEFVFPKLLELRLINLPCLVDICRGDQFEFQLRLQAKGFYEVKHCPNFSQTTIVTLQKVLAWIPYA